MGPVGWLQASDKGEPAVYAGGRVERSAKSSSDGWWSNEEDYGSFLFGCLAPDVDKLCAGLEQGVAQFLPKDEGGIYSYQRICALLNGDY